MSKIKIAIGALVLLSSDEIKLDQDGIRKDLLSMDQRIHANAVQCLAHAAEHGDTSLMRRLLVDIVDAKSGYRRQGLIGWMRKHSPMELKGDNLDLSGLITSEAQQKAMIASFPDVDASLFVLGERRPFLVDEANKAPFTTDSANREVVKPIFQETLVSPLAAAAKRFTTACENTVTVDGKNQPIDASKPFYDGKHMNAVQDFFTKVKELQMALPHDATQELRAAQTRIKQDLSFVETVGANDGTIEVVKAPKANVG